MESRGSNLKKKLNAFMLSTFATFMHIVYRLYCKSLEDDDNWLVTSYFKWHTFDYSYHSKYRHICLNKFLIANSLLFFTFFSKEKPLLKK